MKKFLVTLLVCALFAGLSGPAFAASGTATQAVTITVNEVAKIKTTGSATFTIDAPAAGSEGDIPVITAGTNNTTAGYTSIVPPPVTHRRTLTAAIDAANDPSAIGLTLSLTATPGGTGIVGTTAGSQNLGTTAVTVVNGIGSCYTGQTGVTLLYGLTITNISQLTTATKNVTVTLTLTD